MYRRAGRLTDQNGGFRPGQWSNYPYFPSGNVVFTSIERGLYVVDPAAALARKRGIDGKH